MTTATLSRKDQEIQKYLIVELRWEEGVQANDIDGAVKDGVVTLTGRVDTYLVKWKAEQAPHRVTGVVTVANDIEVRAIEERTDTDIAPAAAHALQWDAGLPADNIQVAVEKGWVTLKGEVEWQYQKPEAQRVVRRLWGVKGVSNLITRKPLASPTDVRKKIEEALVRTAQLDAERITVEVQGTKPQGQGALLGGKTRSGEDSMVASRDHRC